MSHLGAIPAQVRTSVHATAEITATSFHASPVGGGILIGRDGSGVLRRAVITPQALPRDPNPGETWRVTGEERDHAEYGRQLHAEVALPLLPSGRTFVRFLATNPRFPGIGWKTANRLWGALGERLYDIVAAGDVATIAGVIGPELAVGVVQGFGLLADEVEVFRWFDRYGVTPRTAAAAASLWGRGAVSRIEADPYSLALLEPWTLVDTRALRLGLALDDPRRLLAAVEEAFARRYRAGHTAVTQGELKAQLFQLLGFTGAREADAALRRAVDSGRALEHPCGLLQSRATWFMEREVERVVAERCATPLEGPGAADIDAAIATLEEGVGYVLSVRQREAVHMAVSTPFSILCGGAGTGKTTAVRAILAASEAGSAGAGAAHPQVALAGRAAKQIADTTGRPAMTVARFLRLLDTGKDVPRRGLLIVDESSMLDLPSVYRVLSALPLPVNILFIGDPAQLPPIGPGLPFHRMVGARGIPRVELDVVHRQQSATGIPMVARAIRDGRMPELPTFDPSRPGRHGVFIVPARAGATATAALRVFEALAGGPPPPGRMDLMHAADVQILCPVKGGPDGIKEINGMVEARWMVHQAQIPGWGLSVGSKVMWLRNDYAKAPVIGADGQPVLDPTTGEPVCRGFMNGSLGVVVRPTDRGARVRFDDGAEDDIRASDLEKVTRGWAISVHKSQGSAFGKVIIPVARSRLLDRTLIYTAVTRAVDTCVLVGDPALIRAAVEAEPRALARRCCLHFDAPMDGVDP
jgi:exodeoxyribonuclease V alpha subunit